MTDTEKKLADMIARFLNEGDYNDDGDYMFVSDTPDDDPTVEPVPLVPGVVLDASRLLREIKGDKPWP